MRQSAPFRPDDLESLDELFSEAHAVIAMEDVWRGNNRADVVAVRHDVDDNEGSLATAVEFARWEADRGYRSTYFLLHTASYWPADVPEDVMRNGPFCSAVWTIGMLGHEIGIHANALAHAVQHGVDPDACLRGGLNELRWDLGASVIGVVAHGDELCGKYHFVNDEQFLECARSEYGAPDREVGGIKLNPLPLAHFGLRYEAYRLPKSFYASDSGGNWNQPWVDTVRQARSSEGQLHMLIHPDWWVEAF